jgi:hypothetical protein
LRIDIHAGQVASKFDAAERWKNEPGRDRHAVTTNYHQQASALSSGINDLRSRAVTKQV